MADIDLIAFDLDGTVFGIPFKQEMTDRVYQAMQAAHERGVRIAVATGRPVPMIGEQLQNAPWLDWAITVNGASIVDLHGEHRQLDRPIPRWLALQLIRELGDRVSWTGFINGRPFIEEKKILHMAEFGLGAFSDPERLAAEERERGASNDQGDQSVMERFGFNPIEAFASRGQMTVVASMGARIEEMAEGEHVLKLGCGFDSAEDADAAFSELTEAHKDLDIAILNATELEITCAGVNKGSALELLCWRLDIDPARAVAFGDSGNDISMTGCANRFVAMGNADAKIKRRADEVTATVHDDGVAVWIEEHVLGGIAPEAAKLL